jgi:hypothetical protein
MRTGSSLLEVMVCTTLSLSFALAMLNHISPTKDKIILEFKKYTNKIESYQDLENIKETPGGIEILKKICDSIDGSTLNIELSQDEIIILKFLSES